MKIPENSRIPREKPWIFVDLDEVLADFETAAAARHGLNRVQFDAAREPGTWEMLSALGSLSLEEFWEPIHGDEDFWLSLSPTPWSKLLVAYLDNLDVHWRIVTSPSECLTSWTGKVKWVERQLGLPAERVLLTGEKFLLANSGSVLIDDRLETVRLFKEWGGQSVLFPASGNPLHRMRHNPLPFVLSSLERALCTCVQT